MQQYQCIKQPKGFDDINFERKIFNFIKELLYPPKNVKVVRLYCEELKYYIQVKKEDFIECFVKYPYETNMPQKETKEMNKVQRHKELCDQLNETYKKKNKNYGDSYGISVQKYGLIAALTRMSDKWNRLEQLILTRSDGTADESLVDTLVDLANYALMTVIEVENSSKATATQTKSTTKKPYVKPEMEVRQATYEDLEEMFKESI